MKVIALKMCCHSIEQTGQDVMTVVTVLLMCMKMKDCFRLMKNMNLVFMIKEVMLYEMQRVLCLS